MPEEYKIETLARIESDMKEVYKSFTETVEKGGAAV